MNTESDLLKAYAGLKRLLDKWQGHLYAGNAELRDNYRRELDGYMQAIRQVCSEYVYHEMLRIMHTKIDISWEVFEKHSEPHPLDK